MTLPPATKLGPYEVLSLLGAGGMGEVYRARDLRVDRAVALKVLPEELFEGEERRQRFEREARLLASLNHPGIAILYSFEEIPSSSSSVSSSSSTRHLLAMELVEGEDLSQRIAAGPIPVEESLSLARQIAEALEAAHEKGIVHRDLKPANVKLTPDGRVKLLDFGLAKVFENEPGASNPSISYSPTLTARGTAAGVILGTAAYMSPEQARGKPVDKRTDIWAFGCVLFEMLAGKRAFEGETVSDTLAAILRGEPDWAALPEQTPGKIKDLLRKCLRREAKQRLHDIADARLEIEELSAAGMSASVSAHSPFEEMTAVPNPTVGRSAPAVSARGSKRFLSIFLPWALAAAFAAAAGALALRARAPETAVVRAKIAPPEGTNFWLESNGPGPAVV
jgi:serine/threonine protein kinase